MTQLRPVQPEDVCVDYRWGEVGRLMRRYRATTALQPDTFDLTRSACCPQVADPLGFLEVPINLLCSCCDVFEVSQTGPMCVGCCSSVCGTE